MHVLAIVNLRWPHLPQFHKFVLRFHDVRRRLAKEKGPGACHFRGWKHEQRKKILVVWRT